MSLNEHDMSTTDHYPSSEEQQSFYNDWNTKCRGGSFETIDHEIRLRATKVLDLLLSLHLKQPDIVEVGCGTGWFSEKLSDIGKVAAIDLSPEAIAIARGRNVPVEFVAGDFYEWECKKRPLTLGFVLRPYSMLQTSTDSLRNSLI